MVDQTESVAMDRDDGVTMPPAGVLAARYRISVDGRSRPARDRAVATDKESGERVFLKWSADVEAIEHEATILQALTHPGIVGLRKMETGDQGGLLVLELIDGVDLDTWLQSTSRGAAWRNPDQLFASLADAVAAVHAAGFIHRDLKPANILVRPDGNPVIVDFGAASRQDDSLGSHSLLTDGYGAPEQYRTDLAEGPWTDVYGLAAVAYGAINGRSPPSAPARERGAALAPIPNRTQAIEGRLAMAIADGLALDPAARPQTAAAWRDLLVDAKSSMPASEPSIDTLDDYPPTIKVERRQGGGDQVGGRRAARAQATTPSTPRSPSTWRWGVWLTAAGLAVLAAFWFWRPLYERHIKDQWVVDGAGGGDATSIGDALERAREGSVVMIRPGSYRESLEIVRPVRLMATDADAPPEIIAEDAPCLQASGRGSSVSGLTFRAIASAEPAAGAEPSPCILVAGGDLAIEASTIESMSGPAVVIDGGAQSKISGSLIIGGDDLSVLVRAGAEPRIEGNVIEGGDGILFVEGARGIFSNNRIDGSRGSALRVAIGADPIVKDNMIEAAGEAGIFIYDGGKGRFEGNGIEASKLSGVIIGAGAEVELSANRIENSGEHGILVLDGGRAFLDGNALVDNSGYGFAFAWEAEVELGINELSGNKISDLFDARRPRASAASGPISAPPGTSGAAP